jgi:hypothetical protein
MVRVKFTRLDGVSASMDLPHKATMTPNAIADITKECQQKATMTPNAVANTTKECQQKAPRCDHVSMAAGNATTDGTRTHHRHSRFGP